MVHLLQQHEFCQIALKLEEFNGRVEQDAPPSSEIFATDTKRTMKRIYTHQGVLPPLPQDVFMALCLIN
jgi:hypothetical protein